MTTVYRLDTDMNGTDSIADYIEDGRIVNMECGTFEAFDRYGIEIQKKLVAGDFVILDTIGALLNTTRGDRQVGNKADEPLWEPTKVNKFFGDKEYLNVYGMAGTLAMRRLRNLRARGANLIVLAHETEAKEATSGISYKTAVPDVNKAMVGDLTEASSDVFRLVNLSESIADSDGKIIFPADTRVLYLRRKEDVYTAKFHVRRALADAIPKALPNPTIGQLWQTLGKVSSWLTIYGHPGAGKTTLGASVADVLKGGD